MVYLIKESHHKWKKEQYSRFVTRFINRQGNFQVYLDRNYLRVMFRIRLHVDDIAILQKILEFLGWGKVVNEGSRCLFLISDIKNLLIVIFPLIDKYPLYTSKWLDYIYFKSVVIFLSESSTTRLSLSQLEWIKGIMSQMNLGQTQYNYELIPKIIINPFWLLGFIEADKTFGFKKLNTLFSIRTTQ